MDKNNIIGFGLIAAILVGFFYITKPSEEQIAAQQRYQDSIKYEQQLQQVEKVAQSAATVNTQIQDSIATDSTVISQQSLMEYGVFAANAAGEENSFEIENEVLKLKFSNKGGRISSVELKKYRTHDSLPLILFDGNEAQFGLKLAISTGAGSNTVVNTSELFFTPVTVSDSMVVMRLAVNEQSYIDFIYQIPADNYMLHFQVKPVNMQAYLPVNVNYAELHWQSKIRQQERGRKFENQYSEIFFKYLADDVDNFGSTRDGSKNLNNRLKWVAFKSQFFSSILIADNSFTSADVSQEIFKDTKNPYLKDFKADLVSDFDVLGEQPLNFRFYYGPNHYKTLNSYDKGAKDDEVLDIQRLVPLGWKLFRWVNLILVIPMFNFFGGFITNYGIIILLMTLVIKLILYPLTYKSYMSSAKMRVLKPEIEEIHAKIPANKMQERQRATMELYNKVGINPMGGCLPMLLQMPILFAMFSFFPSSIELRQQAFLWADDLSSYDAIISWNAQIPLISEYFGNHLSLFCLLMTITNIAYTKINMATMDTGANAQMPGMKMMMYIMPVMFLFIFNNYASGLSYYYFVSTLITIAQTYIIRAFVDDKKILAQLNANRNKPRKKSGFMARLEEAQKAQMEAQKKRKR
ncbi:MAG: membrane protein insertase YidC [Prevotellaceae bacterium]|jgi:YidC/Oxa1 family membrane protein insertase|nr:membrane protein insertase YidC [Prevotellaceae bacterium]